MDKKSKKFNIIFIALSILVPVLLTIVAISIIRAWYTNVIQTGSLDAETKNVAIKYQLNGGDENVTTYSISNLVFFDANSDKEEKYLKTMAFEINLKLTNNSSDDISYKIEFESIKTKLTTVSVAYAACIYDSVEVSGNETVDDYLVSNTTNKTTYEKAYDSNTKFKATKESSVNLAPNAFTTVKLYVIGIQEVDSALSTDFLYTDSTKADTKSYNFTLTIVGTPMGSATVEESQAEGD